MKKLFFSFVAFVLATMCWAQQTLVATLTHGDEISMFYGTYALRDALSAAVDGDVINLSGGVFQPTTINKAVTLRGTGVGVENPTTITNYLYVEIPSTATERLMMEGLLVQHLSVKGTMSNAYFLKNKFGGIFVENDSEINNMMFVHCIIENCANISSSCSWQFVNSHVSRFSVKQNAMLKSAFVNCCVFGYFDKDQHYSSFVNCILGSSTGASLPSTCEAFNCVSIGGNVYNYVANGSNNSIADATIFMDSDSTKDLTDEAKATYLGTDGTPVGMYGGSLPFSFTPTYPQITKMNVASKTTADGKLSVDIEVSAVQ